MSYEVVYSNFHKGRNSKGVKTEQTKVDEGRTVCEKRNRFIKYLINVIP